MNYLNMEIENTYLDFTKGWSIRRLSYAASFGSDEWEYDEKQTESYKRLLAEFDAVSCRENSGEVFCKSILGFKDACTVLDPTMLLNSGDYLALCKDSEYVEYNNNKGLMSYVLDKDKRSEEIVRFIQKQLGCQLFEFNVLTPSFSNDCEDKIQPSVEMWIRGFQNADFIVTDSFHACVFAILFHKPFLAIVNHDRGSARYYSLLERFGLENRIVQFFDEEKIKTILSTPIVIDQKVLEDQREYSLNYLKKNLSVKDS